MSDLAKQRCEPCTADTPRLDAAEVAKLMPQLPGWSVSGEAAAGGQRLAKEYGFPDFRQALSFVDRVGEVAEEAGHHPDIELGWGRVKITLWTHSIGGLSKSDLIVAAKADGVLKP
jgi:4a-hydroxytetrahydrobiopterin dehydratase